jgi:hypothetical protein
MVNNAATLHGDDPATSRMQWGRIVLAAVVLEVILALVEGPMSVFLKPNYPTFFRSTIHPVGFIVSYLIGWWGVRRISSRLVLHGALVGIVATLLFLALVEVMESIPSVIAQYGVFNFYLGQVLRVAGCTTAALIAQKQRQP